MLKLLLLPLIQDLEARTAAIYIRSILVTFSEAGEEMRTKYQIYEALLEMMRRRNAESNLLLNTVEMYLEMGIGTGMLIELSPGVYMRTSDGRVVGNSAHAEISAKNS